MGTVDDGGFGALSNLLDLALGHKALFHVLSLPLQVYQGGLKVCGLLHTEFGSLLLGLPVTVSLL